MIDEDRQRANRAADAIEAGECPSEVDNVYFGRDTVLFCDKGYQHPGDHRGYSERWKMDFSWPRP